MENNSKSKVQLLEELQELRQQNNDLRKLLSESRSNNVNEEYGFNYQKTVSDISLRFINISDYYDAINEALSGLGRLAGACRAYVFLTNKEGTKISNTQEWVAEGVEPQIDSLQNLSTETFSWSMKKLRRGETIHIEDVSKMDPEAAAERESFERQGIKSLMILPIFVKKRFVGFVGFDNVKRTGEWSKENYRLLEVFAEVIGDALNHWWTDMALENRVHELDERIKELNCLYSILKYFEMTGLSKDEVFQKVVNIIPKTWQYPDKTCARINFNEMEYKTKNFKETEWKQNSDIKLHGEVIGSVEVYYLERKPKADEGPFVKEERNLIDAIGELMGRYTERKKIEEELKISEEKYRILLNVIPDMMFRISKEGTYLEFIPSQESEPILQPNEFIGKKVGEILPETITKQTMQSINRVLKTDTMQMFEYRLPFPYPDGDLRSYEARLVRSGENEVLAIIRDITEKKKIEEKLKIYATTDSLTGVLNRRSGLLLFRKQLQISKRSRDKICISYVDINKLKDINDTYGHHEGDEVLKKVSNIFKKEIREADILCRIGGDEFLLVFPQCTLEKLHGIWERIAKRIKDLNNSGVNPYTINVSRGLVEYDPKEEKSLEQLISLADYEMYKVKYKIS
jgi:diguanylate cyclase (GGDEF)-like protein/PAS domain S-box-containing protein